MILTMQPYAIRDTIRRAELQLGALLDLFDSPDITNAEQLAELFGQNAAEMRESRRSLAQARDLPWVSK